MGIHYESYVWVLSGKSQVGEERTLISRAESRSVDENVPGPRNHTKKLKEKPGDTEAD